MKFKCLVYLAVPSLLGLTISCEDMNLTQNQPMESERLPVYESSKFQWEEEDFTPWQSRAELQVLMEQQRKDLYFAAVQGREQNGFEEYRAVRIPFDDPSVDRWAVFWGLSDEELFEAETKLLRLGFRKHYRQAFVGGGGEMHNQVVYLRPDASYNARLQNERGAQVADRVIPAPSKQENPVCELLPSGSELLENGSLAEMAGEESQPKKDFSPVMIKYEPVSNIEAPLESKIVAKTAEVKVEKGEEPAPLKETAEVEAKPVAKAQVETKPETKASSKIYRVTKGDTLSGIAKKYRCSVSSLKKVNGLKSDLINIGQRLKVPQN